MDSRSLPHRSCRNEAQRTDGLENKFRVNPYLLKIDRVRNRGDGRAFDSGCIEVIKRPFKVFILKRFFKNISAAKLIEKEVVKLNFEPGKNDLFSFQQSKDLRAFDPNSCFYMIRQVFDQKVRHIFNNLFKVNLDGSLSIAVSKYVDTDHLLCHDDKFSDRHIAFIYYVNRNWKAENGGVFEMLDHDKFGRPAGKVHSISPQFNTLLCFEVSRYSYHKVSEVVADMSKGRYAISGWFHSSAAKDLSKHILDKKNVPSTDELPYCAPLMYSEVHDLSIFRLSPDHYLATADEIVRRFKDDGVVMFDNFLESDFFHDICEELKSDRIKWIRLGPPDIRNVESAKLKTQIGSSGAVPGALALSALLDVFQTTTAISFFRNFINFDYNGVINVQVEIEVNRWRRGCYTLAQYSGIVESYDRSFELVMFFNTKYLKQRFDAGCGGFLHNVSDGNHEEYIKPTDNALIIINRPFGKNPYIKYLNHRLKKATFHSIRFRYYIKIINEIGDAEDLFLEETSD
ncbi:prolyl 3-hydroxylase sud1 [Lycorma delicatula]|uniref:prolyl 3-hydroxylase sud1 n=1 Tax=Lycorma delicatula TaxID=130591 RepID=UPI003F516F32